MAKVIKAAGHNQSADKATPPEQLGQAVQLLQLLVAQLQSAVADNNLNMARLGNAYETIITTCQPLVESHDSLTEGRIHGEMNRISIAFQGHDAFNQRLEHAINGLRALGELLTDGKRHDLDGAWQALEAQLNASYTTREEQRIHEKEKNRAVGAAEPGERHDNLPSGSENGSIELF